VGPVSVEVEGGRVSSYPRGKGQGGAHFLVQGKKSRAVIVSSRDIILALPPRQKKRELPKVANSTMCYDAKGRRTTRILVVGKFYIFIQQGVWG